MITRFCLLPRLGGFPFPLVAYDSGSVLAVKSPLRRFAPWTAPGRKEPFGPTNALSRSGGAESPAGP